MENKEAKGIFALVAAVFGYLTGRINELVIILTFFMILDYVSGVTAAFVEKRLESRKSLIGIFKKLGYMALVAIAFFIDFIIMYLSKSVGITLPMTGLFGIATCCWLIGTEGLSILENLNIIGVPFPQFLKAAFSRLKEGSVKMVKKEGKINQ